MAKYKIIPSSKTIVQSPISIGHKAEKGVEAIEFDLTAWVETYGSGTATIIMRRWGDAIPYPIALEIDENNKATWTLSDIDTAKAGMAYAQLSYIVGETVVKKSDIYTFRVMDSLTGEGDPPEAYESWLEHLTHFAAEAMAEVLDIEGIVTDKTLTVDGGVADAKATGDALALKADKSTTYTKGEVDQMIEDVEVETDTTLTVSGAPADAAETGRQIGLLKADLDDLKEHTISDEVKQALLACFQKVGWSTSTNKVYYDNLYNALYPDTPVPAGYQFDFAKSVFEIGGISPTSPDENCIIYNNDLQNRARMLCLMPFTSGTITAKSGYNICCYMLNGINLVPNVNKRKELIPGTSGFKGLINYNPSPAWVESFNVSDANCKYVALCLKKTSNENWTAQELAAAYGNIFTAQGNQPILQEILAVTNGKTVMPSVDDVSKNVIIDGVINYQLIESSVDARAHTNILPFSSGIFESADANKYQICLYQLTSFGTIIIDLDNPHLQNSFPAWDIRYEIGAKKCFAVQIALKKLDGTSFTQDEIDEAYGTVFRYYEGV